MSIQDLVHQFKPIIYIPKESANFTLVEVLCEIFENFVVLWYYWPADDYTGKEDYEPIILFFKENKLRAIGIRPHQRHKYYERWVTEGFRPIIVFESAWHAPHVMSGRLHDALISPFTNTLFSEKKTDYELSYRSPPSWYVKDGTNISIYDYAQQISRIL